MNTTSIARRCIKTIAVTVMFVSSLFVGTSQAYADTTSTGLTCTKVGTEGDDVLLGTSRADVICGLGGNDTISGVGGNDVIDGGSGNDTISGGVGNDTMLGGTGADTFAGGAGTDTTSYADHTESVVVDINGTANDGATSENDTVQTDVENLTGGSGDDSLTGSSVINVLSGGDGSDTIDGGAGNDTVTGGTGDDTIAGGLGNDTVTGGTGDDTIAGGLGNDTVTGGIGDDTLDGGAGNDTANGETGDDTIAGDLGNDTVTGGTGDDTLDGGDGSDKANGDAGDDTIAGGLGNDTINGGDGADALSGDGGVDTVNGGTGLNTCLYDALDRYVGGSCDIGGPRVTSYSISTASIDTSGASQGFIVTYTATDDLSGISDSGCNITAHKDDDETLQRAPDTQTKVVTTSNIFGDIKVVYTANFTFPRYSAQGFWIVGDFTCYDKVGNVGRYFVGDDGFWTYRSNDVPIALTRTQKLFVLKINQTGTGDAAQPQLLGVTVSTSSIDTFAGTATVTYRVHLTDDIALCDCGIGFQVRAPTVATALTGTVLFVDGTTADGYWEGTITYPRYWPQGDTTFVSISVRDASGREHRYGGGSTPMPDSVATSATVNQTGIGDIEGVTITNIELVGDAPDTRLGDDTITLRFTITDNLSGVRLDDSGGTQVSFTAVNGGTLFRGSIYDTDIISHSGDWLSVVVESTFTLPHLSASGRWDLEAVSMFDEVSNIIYYFLPFYFTNS
jgi:hypothetical protein